MRYRGQFAAGSAVYLTGGAKGGHQSEKAQQCCLVDQEQLFIFHWEMAFCHFQRRTLMKPQHALSTLSPILEIAQVTDFFFFKYFCKTSILLHQTLYNTLFTVSDGHLI